jgi:hypothetical protein
MPPRTGARVLCLPRLRAHPRGPGRRGRCQGQGGKKAKKDGEDGFGHGANCPRAGEPPRPLAITTRNEAATLRFVVDLPPDFAVADYQRWGHSLGYALRTGMRQLHLLDGSEIVFVLEPMWESHADGQHFRRGGLTFVDPALGGSGFLERAAEELHLLARRTLERLDHPNCESACYRCLKSYQNQRHHAHLSWPHVLPNLEALASAAPTLLPAEKGDGADPRPWLDAYEAGVGSPLELAFLKQFESLGLVVDKQVPISPEVGGKPISVADFVVSGSRTAIYVDGAAFHRGAALRCDRYIRQRLVPEIRRGRLWS